MMGILDDAIREHLELKRRQGADPSEIARLEREALGPVRREPVQATSPESGATAELDESAVAYDRESERGDAEYEEFYEEAYHEEEGGDDRAEPFAEDLERRRTQSSRREAPLSDVEPSTELPEEHEEEHGFRRWIHPRRRRVPPEDAPHTQADPPEDVDEGAETVETQADDALAAERRRRGDQVRKDHPPPGEEGDVLEETPEFLQDAPEHDRLWFEQRPPRDFDFDD
jgi:hypothetical protein